MRLIAPANESERFAAMVVFTTSNGWPSVVTSNMLRPAPSSKLLNLTGFFSIFCVDGVEFPIAACADISGVNVQLSALTKGEVRLRCLERWR
jgi:hypothetical protein